MNEVYLVSDGSYSSYEVLGIYTTLEKAEEARKHFAAYNDIETFVLDACPDHPEVMYFFSVRMSKYGDVLEVSMKNVLDFKDHKDKPYGDGESYFFCQFAKDEKHAIKIANEKRLCLIASNMWYDSWEKWHEDQKEFEKEQKDAISKINN